MMLLPVMMMMMMMTMVLVFEHKVLTSIIIIIIKMQHSLEGLYINIQLYDTKILSLHAILFNYECQLKYSLIPCCPTYILFLILIADKLMRI